ncbi:unnamed protein product [Brachionus calyciflorus]|uniref:Rad21/Rec8-like protein N-terminal domain-containing protein n=1 Tax=Brachionus calyciflorus TaxID=104777 RepID=A0A813T541_9BILA|nr:unnamed protein product [Brachionus calyciflorus]
MNFQITLLRRRGRFGTVWLAAHHPTKLTKTEIVHLNLTNKCNEMLEFVTNEHQNRPRFSLVISSHLMYGLCVLIKKQIQFIYDDLMYLKQEIHKCYINEKLVIKKAKTPRKRVKSVEKTMITLQENLPDLITSFETFYEQENVRLRQQLDLTVERVETPIIHKVPISLVEESLEPINVVQTEDFQFDTGLQFFQDSLFNVENLERTEFPSTSKFQDRIQSRVPFRELSTNEQLRRAELTTSLAAGGQETTVYDELESLLYAKRPIRDQENIPLPVQPPEQIELPPPGLIPELYQETIMEPQVAPVEPSIVPPEQPSEIPPIEVTEGAQVEVTIQPEIKTRMRVKKTKKRGLIIDEATSISHDEMSRRIKKTEEEQRLHLDQLFEKNRQEIKSNLEFFQKNLLNEPDSLLMRKKRFYSVKDKGHFIKSRLIIRNMKSNKLMEDKYFYTTEGRGYEQESESLIRLDVEERRETRESLIRGRKRESTTRVESESAQISAKMTRSEIGEMTESRFNVEDSNTIQFQEQQSEVLQPPALFAPPEETPLINIQPPSPDKIIEPDLFERVLINGIRLMESRNEIPIFQTIQKETNPRDFGISSRRMFANKLFRQSLVMCAINKLEAQQDETFGDIRLNLI